MNGNYVTLSLETYDIEKTLKDLIDGLNQFVEDMNKNYEENQEVESCQEKK